MIKESEYFSKVIEREYNKYLVMNKNNMKILKILLNIGYVKEYMKKVRLKQKILSASLENNRGSTHQECNINFNLSKKKSLLC